MKLTPGKLEGLLRVSDKRGVIAAAAMDQRGSLQKSLAKEKGTDVTDAARDGIGNVYVDDESEPPDYATLPAFWPAEIAAVTRATAPPG